MIPEIFHDEKVVIEAVQYLPSISIILPFEPKIFGRKELEYRLQRVYERVEKELNAAYPEETVNPLTARLSELIKKLDYSTYKQSVAILVSPLVEKVYYLDIPVEEKVIIDESFEIRDLVHCKKDIHKYLILVLSSVNSRVFLGNTTQFLRIAFNTPAHIAAYKNDIPERVANFSDPSERKEIMLDKFLHHVDNELGVILKAYALPLFVMGTERTIGHFKKITHHAEHISGYVPGNYEDAAEQAIRDAIAPHVADWKKVKQDNLLRKLDTAMGGKKLVKGIQEVWRQAADKRGRLLVVEKNYMCVARHGAQDNLIHPLKETDNTPFYIKDAVDDVIEKVLKYGGDVEFVDEGMLKDYGHIALVLFY